MLACLFNAAMWSPAWKRLTPWLSCAWCFVMFCHFPVWCPGSGEVLDCIDSLSLSPYLRCFTNKILEKKNAATQEISKKIFHLVVIFNVGQMEIFSQIHFNILPKANLKSLCTI